MHTLVMNQHGVPGAPTYRVIFGDAIIAPILSWEEAIKLVNYLNGGLGYPFGSTALEVYTLET